MSDHPIVLPTPLTKAERQRFAAGERDDEIRALTEGERPNQAPRDGTFDRCPMSKYQTHRFNANLWSTCEFCGKHWKDCVRETPTK